MNYTVCATLCNLCRGWGTSDGDRNRQWGVAARRTLWLGIRVDIGFHELHATVNCAIYFTYKYFSAYPGCVIGGGLARLATCFEETVVCNWTGWTGCTAFIGICFAWCPCVIQKIRANYA